MGEIDKMGTLTTFVQRKRKKKNVCLQIQSDQGISTLEDTLHPLTVSGVQPKKEHTKRNYRLVATNFIN